MRVYSGEDILPVRYTTLVSSGLAIILSILVAVIVSRDIKKLGIKTNYVILATILFRPVGVCAFLLYAIHNECNEPGKEKEGPG
jgi:hypothetical protein